MATTNALDIAAFLIAVVGFCLVVLILTVPAESGYLVWRHPGRIAARTGLGIGLFAGILALASWGLASYIATVLDQGSANVAAPPGMALLYFWLGIAVAHAPLSAFTAFRSTHRFGLGVIAGVLAGSLFAVGTAAGVTLFISGLPTPSGGVGSVVALSSAVLVLSWILPSAVLATLGCLAAKIAYPAPLEF